MWRSIVCGVDAHRGCVEAVRLAAAVARDQAARLVLLHVVDEAEAAILRDAGDERPDSAVRWAGLASDLRGEPVQSAVVTGDAAERIVDFARRIAADLIVLGSHTRARTALDAMSVAGKVIAVAPCPVIVVPSELLELPAPPPDQLACTD